VSDDQRTTALGGTYCKDSSWCHKTDCPKHRAQFDRSVGQVRWEPMMLTSKCPRCHARNPRATGRALYE